MMDADALVMMLIIIAYVLLFSIIVVAIGLVAGYIASLMGFTGIMWWAVTILFYLIIGAIIGMINRIGG